MEFRYPMSLFRNFFHKMITTTGMSCKLSDNYLQVGYPEFNLKQQHRSVFFKNGHAAQWNYS